MNRGIWVLGPAAALATVAGAHAADLPARKAAPVDYVTICDAYGPGFFYIPGTDTCLRLGGLVQADWAVSNTPNRYNLNNAAYNIAPYLLGTGLGSSPNSPGAMPAAYVPSAARDAVASQALGRLEMDARTQSPWGAVRAFMRIDSYFGAGATANTGAMPADALALPSYTGVTPARETTWLNKAFLQFAGITMGRTQSTFDFYADAVGYTNHPGSNQTVNAIAYTAVFGGGFTGTVSVEDSVSHRAAVGSVLAFGGPFIGGVAPAASGAPSAELNGTRMPDVVANVRLTEPWGAAQLSGAIHQVRAGLYTLGGAAPGGVPDGIVVGPAAAQPFSGLGNFANVSSIGFAVQAGLKFNLDVLAPGDVLGLQATYAKGAVGYTTGTNFNFNNGVNSSNSYGYGLGRMSSGNGWAGGQDYDCVWTYAGACDKSRALAITGALRHYWVPTISSTLSASYFGVNYSANAIDPIPGAVAAGSTHAGVGMTNYRQTILATGLDWNPVKNFGVGVEVAWTHGIVSRPIGLVYDPTLAISGFSFNGDNDLYRGRVRMYRAF